MVDSIDHYSKVIMPALLGVLVFSSQALLAHSAEFDNRPGFIHGDILHSHYDGTDDDLLSAGLGKSGLASTTPPVVSAPPTPAELRRLAIYNNYRALVDMTAGGGYGVFYGPNIAPDGSDTGTEGLIPGYEFLAYADNGSGRKNVTLMVQVPDHFDPDHACIITAPSSGSRGIYGAIATAGEWGLKHGCAVAYTDKGTGNGAHDLQDNTVDLITGERAGADEAGKDSQFTARLGDRRRARFNSETPYRFAYKHAHSRNNPESDWGKNVLQSVRFAFYVLNELYADNDDKAGKKKRRIRPANTIVIASSVSNGGGASLQAAEQDAAGLIDGVAVSEPNVNPRFDDNFAIVQGDGEPFFQHSRSLYDYTTLLNVYQGCASVDAGSAAPLNAAASPERCLSLHEKGLLDSTTLEEQAAEAQQIINDFGILPEQNRLQPSHWFVNVPQGIAVTYANSYARARVTDNLCAYSFAATDAAGQPAPLPETAEAVIFGTNNGIPPTSGINLINNDSAEGPLLDRDSISASTGRKDQNLDGALCLRALAIGEDPVSGDRLDKPALESAKTIRESIRGIRVSGRLKKTPAVIVTGRADAILPLNHTSRAYFGLNQRVEGDKSRLHYYEITNAHHLDAFNAFAGFNNAYIPLHHYFISALDLMYAHLTGGAVLPPSQVVHTLPRGIDADGNVPDLTADNLPALAGQPDTGALITFSDTILHIPD